MTASDRGKSERTIVPLREKPLYLAVTLPVYPNGQLCPFGNNRYIYPDNLYLAGG